MGRPPDDSRRRQAIGRSRGGLTSKLMALVDHRGRLVRFTVRPGNAAEVRELDTLLGGVQGPGGRGVDMIFDRIAESMW